MKSISTTFLFFTKFHLQERTLSLKRKLKQELFFIRLSIIKPFKSNTQVQERYFDSISVLNFYIMDSLLIEKNLSGNKFETFFNQLSTNRNTKTFEFITRYINKLRHKSITPIY